MGDLRGRGTDMRLVALVGADGMGKTTQAELLTTRLRSCGRDAARVQPLLMLFNPWEGDPQSGLGRSLSPRLRRARADGSRRVVPSLRRLARALAGTAYAVGSYVFLRTRFRHQEIIVCDRYFYQYFYDLFGTLAKGLALTFPRPDLAFWLEGSPELIRERTADENLQGDWNPYYESLLTYYREIAAPLGFIRIDARAPATEITDLIWGSMMNDLGGRPREG